MLCYIGSERSDKASCLYTLHSTPYTKTRLRRVKAIFEMLKMTDKYAFLCSLLCMQNTF